ncbi:thiol peroxidase [Mycoplasmopsis mucosicanis]|uniref:Thiol peroxidase n=1 Tax=Mycoplasmopsis mucosicanis TaxID=458208 RepID=A0A507SQR8_9BACT|nr:thiol peroxidase [Mycoplasmopsis mucosicanis]TQC54137.1 thiol peroxidase [Mycoplasmopsis mucosicanis]
MQVNLKGQNVNLLGSTIKLGDTFPNFKAVNLDLSDFELYQAPKAKKLIFSIPSIDTGVCEIESGKFMNYFSNKNYLVYAISKDLPFAFNRWCVANQNQAIKPLSDYKYNEFGIKSGTLLENVGLLTRAIFVLDEENKVIHVEYVKNVSDEPNYEDVYAFFK